MKKISVNLIMVFSFFLAFLPHNVNACTANSASTLRSCLEGADEIINIDSTGLGNTYKEVFEIKRDVQIIGSSDKSSFAGQFKIVNTNSNNKVVIKNLKISFRLDVDDNNYSNILVTSPVDLTISNIYTSYASGTLSTLEFRTINFEGNIDDSKVNIENSTINGFFDGIRIGGDNVTVNIKDSYIHSRYALAIGKEGEQHSKNRVNISNSKLYATSNNEAEAALIIGGQDDLEVNIDGKSELSNSNYDNANKPKAADIIRFYNGKDNTLKNTNVTINIKDQTIIDDESINNAPNHLFHFGAANLDSNNVINIGKDVKMELNGKDKIEIAKKYNNDQTGYYIVGLYDFDGSSTIKTYPTSDVDEQTDLAMQEIANKVEENYKFKGWYTDVDLTNSKPTNITSNIDLYPKKVKIYTVTIAGEEFKEVEEGQSLKDFALSKINELKNPGNKIIENFYKENADGSETVIDKDSILDYEVYEDLKINVKYNVKITIKDDSETEFIIPEGGTLDGQDLESLKEATDKQFDHFEANNEKVIESGDGATKFTENTELVRKYTVNVTIEGQTNNPYKLNEGDTLDTLDTKYDKILEKLEKVTNGGKKTFKEFRNTATNTKIDKTSQVTKNITIKPIYEVEVTIGKTKISVEEGTTWEQLQTNDLAKQALSELENINASRFVRFEINGTPLTNEYVFNEPEEITARFKIIITIGEEQLSLLEGENFNNLSASDEEKVTNLKNVANKTFSHFEKTGEEIDVYNTPFNEDTVLTPVYNVNVLLNGKTYTLRDDQSILSYNNTEINELLDNVVAKRFSHFLNEKNEVINRDTIITENMELKPIYVIDITIGDESVTVNENSTWQEILTKINSSSLTQEALENLKNSGSKKWAYFVDDDNNKIENDTIFTKHTTISSKFYVKVTIQNQAFADKYLEVIEGENLNSLTPDNQAILDEIKNQANKTFSHFAKDGEVYNLEDAINEDVTLTAVYEIIITINEEEFTLYDNQTLNSLGDKLDHFKNISDKSFAYFAKDGAKVFEDSTTFSENTTITPIYTITITIEDEEFSNIADNLTFEEIKNISGIKEKLASLENDHFAYYEILGKEVKDTDVISTNTTITPVYYVFLKVNDVTIKLLKGHSFKTLTSTEKAKISQFENPSDKSFKYYLANNEIVTDETTFDTDTILVPKYTIKITIDDEEFTLDEGSKLTDLATQEKYQALKNPQDKQFKYFKNGNEIVNEEQDIFTSNTTLDAIYEVTVTIGSEKINVLENTSFQQLKENSDVNNWLANLKDNSNKEFAMFVDEDNQEILDTTLFIKNTTILPKFSIIISVADHEFKLLEGQTLNDLSEEDKAILEQLMESSNQVFSHYINKETKEVVNNDTKLYENTTLEMVLEEQENINNPQTGDNIFKYIGLAIVMIILIGSCLKKLMAYNKN